MLLISLLIFSSLSPEGALLTVMVEKANSLSTLPKALLLRSKSWTLPFSRANFPSGVSSLGFVATSPSLRFAHFPTPLIPL